MIRAGIAFFQTIAAAGHVAAAGHLLFASSPVLLDVTSHALLLTA